MKKTLVIIGIITLFVLTYAVMFLLTEWAIMTLFGHNITFGQFLAGVILGSILGSFFTSNNRR